MKMGMRHIKLFIGDNPLPRRARLLRGPPEVGRTALPMFRCGFGVVREWFGRSLEVLRRHRDGPRIAMSNPGTRPGGLAPGGMPDPSRTAPGPHGNHMEIEGRATMRTAAGPRRGPRSRNCGPP